ncbi:uncharacterized protein LOC133391068 [Anopheles gambiae]|uniref:uncharacterized protein LOC133391068 n=1 Tax=Anopheles gambiae TaxID=7165 RepID=UPI002AC9947B|nr:uncharacterized protein LOC133391068 [Anopheles gambiae]
MLNLRLRIYFLNALSCFVLVPPQLSEFIREQLHFPAMSDDLSNNDHNYNRRLRRNRRWWMRPVFFRRRQDGNRLLDDIKAEMVNDTIKNFMRMKHEDFDRLYVLVGPEISRMDTNVREAITAQERLLITLRYLATGETFASLQYLFWIPSTAEEWKEKSKKFEQRWNFPHAIGSIDGKHVQVEKPSNSGSEYYNYQHYFSIVLLAVVDADYNFLHADIGGKGGISDGGVFKNTRLYQKLENNSLNVPEPEPLRVPYAMRVPYFLLGDKAFAFTRYCIRPFGGMHAEGTIERVFNKRHSRARMIVENVFGILANRFRIFKSPILLEPEEAKTVIMTTIYLHNFLRQSASRNTYTRPSSFDRVVNGRFVGGERAPTTMSGLQGIPCRTPNDLLNIRLHIAHDLKYNNQLNH